ncbi:hypothetical protein F511_40822 [Dorcoceras hygrometricum]|uniref:Uncharacterized protein n=1 Tax=Dorcoceras hygrometricum TaxID=472368 RepID=A0A2Z7A5H3_9LAMI|nr:hypothetical protein F511_40822 [Dorcoceras hygrometricum]
MDRIGDFYRNQPRRADIIVNTVGARHKCQQGSGFEPPIIKIKASKLAADHRNHPPRPCACRTRCAPRPCACHTRCAPRPRSSSASAARCLTAHRALAARMVRWWPLRTTAALAGRAPLCARRAALAETLRDGWPLIMRWPHGSRRWPMRRCSRLMADVTRADCCAMVTAVCHEKARDGDAPCRGRACALCAACDFVGGGGRRPIAAPASLRRCRDGWSEFF